MRPRILIIIIVIIIIVVVIICVIIVHGMASEGRLDDQEDDQ